MSISVSLTGNSSGLGSILALFCELGGGGGALFLVGPPASLCVTSRAVRLKFLGGAVGPGLENKEKY
jgi:hypothetical protein